MPTHTEVHTADQGSATRCDDCPVSLRVGLECHPQPPSVGGSRSSQRRRSAAMPSAAMGSSPAPLPRGPPVESDAAARLAQFQPDGDHAPVAADQAPYGRMLSGIRGLRLEVTEVLAKLARAATYGFGLPLSNLLPDAPRRALGVGRPIGRTPTTISRGISDWLRETDVTHTLSPRLA